MSGDDRTLAEFTDPRAPLASHHQPDRIGSGALSDDYRESSLSNADDVSLKTETDLAKTRCVFCHQSFSYHPSMTLGNYCTFSCFVKACTHEESPFWANQSSTVHCRVCGDPFETPSPTEPKRATCSTACSRALRAANHSSADRPTWRGTGERSPVRYGSKWLRIRDRVRADTCEMPGCSKTKTDHGTALHVHHIVPVSAFDDPDDAHFADNLITLCRTHHVLVEHHGMNATLDGYSPNSPS